jgi:hypothetical protein
MTVQPAFTGLMQLAQFEKSMRLNDEKIAQNSMILLSSSKHNIEYFLPFHLV